MRRQLIGLGFTTLIFSGGVASAVAAVPESVTMIIFGTGLLGLAGRGGNKQK